MSEFDTVISTRVRLARNVKDMPFPAKLSNDERIYSVLMAGVQNAASRIDDFTFYKLSNLSEMERMSLFEKHLISIDLLNNVDKGAVFINNDGTMSIMINEEDHIRAQALLSGFQPEKAYKLINDFDNELAKEIPLAFDDKYGYLTSCPTNLGTGMRLSIMMFLPALTVTQRAAGLLASAQKAGITSRGFYGEGSDNDGYIYQISNQNSFGLSEAEILKRVSNAVKKISDEELNSRQALYKTDQTEMKDKIFRSLGLLTCAYVLPRKEFMSLLANVKLGVYYKLLDIPYQELNALLLDTEQSNLCKITKKALSEREIDVARAVLCRERLKSYLKF